MKVVILAGGYGTRLSEETHALPKPMVEVGGKPLIWHIMKIYSHFGFNDFYVLLGYKGYVIKEYFCNYFLHQSDITIDLSINRTEILKRVSEPWRITLLDTGEGTMTGGRLLRAKDALKDAPFMVTYGDGVADVDIPALLDFHKKKAAIATVTSVQPEGRFGAIEADATGRATGFTEKIKGDGQWINGGFFVFEPAIFDYIQSGDASILEQEPLRNLAADGKLYSYQHRGFWKCMDTMRDKKSLETLWADGAPWKVWNE